MYPSASRAPGHPLWALYGFIWIKLFPFSNIAWRLGIATTAAAALTCGVIASTVSQLGLLILNDPQFESWTAKEKKTALLVAATVSGLGLAFEKAFWKRAVVIDPWCLAALLFALTLFCSIRWGFDPSLKRWLFAAFFLAGIALCESQALAPAIFCLPLLIAVENLHVGRNLFCVQSVVLWTARFSANILRNLGWEISAVSFLITSLAVGTAVAWAACCWATRKAFSEYRTVVTGSAFFCGGLGFYFLLPLFSMTNPPFNSGYARTVEGLWHLISRGQFDSIQPTPNLHRFLTQICSYSRDLFFDVGAMYLVAAFATLIMFPKAPRGIRKLIVCFWLMWILTTIVTIAGLNVDGREIESIRIFFVPGNAILMMLAGIGITLIAAHTKTHRETKTSHTGEND
jgi:hypothetical protein